MEDRLDVEGIEPGEKAGGQLQSARWCPVGTETHLWGLLIGPDGALVSTGMKYHTHSHILAIKFSLIFEKGHTHKGRKATFPSWYHLPGTTAFTLSFLAKIPVHQGLEMPNIRRSSMDVRFNPDSAWFKADALINTACCPNCCEHWKWVMKREKCRSILNQSKARWNFQETTNKGNCTSGKGSLLHAAFPPPLGHIRTGFGPGALPHHTACARRITCCGTIFPCSGTRSVPLFCLSMRVNGPQAHPRLSAFMLHKRGVRVPSTVAWQEWA